MNKMILYSIGVLISAVILSSCEDDVLLEDMNTSSASGGSYGKLIIDNDSISNDYLFNNENKEIY